MKDKRLLLRIIGLVAIIAVAGFVLLSGEDAATTGGNTTDGLISPVEYQAQFASDDHFLLDVRTPQEFADGHIEGAVNIPVQVLDQYISQIPDDMPVVLYCRSGNRSAQAVNILESAGFTDLYDIDGGVIAWTRSNLPLQ